MKYATAGAFRTALERRLLTQANQTNIPLARLRKLVVFDRLLARLLIAAPDRWILKGALALDYRWGTRIRMTKDLDLSRQDSEEVATRDFVAAQSVDLDDYFIFIIQKTAKLDQALEGAAVRYHVSANLAGRRFEDVIVDVGFRDPWFSVPEILSGPDLLGFADIDAAAVPAIPLEQHIAEKVHACTRVYTGQRQSSRVKDLIDLILIQAHANVNAGRLRGPASHLHQPRYSRPADSIPISISELGASLSSLGQRSRTFSRYPDRISNGRCVSQPSVE